MGIEIFISLVVMKSTSLLFIALFLLVIMMTMITSILGLSSGEPSSTPYVHSRVVSSRLVPTIQIWISFLPALAFVI